MREGGAKGKTTEGRRGRVDVKESMTYCAAGRLEPASRVGDMLLRATSRSQPALFAPRPLPPLSCAINHVAPFPAPPQVKGLPGEFSSGATQIKSNNGGEDTKDTQTKVTRVRPSPPIRELYFFLSFSLNITGAHYLLPGGILHALIKKQFGCNFSCQKSAWM